ncbi:competence protein ComK [Niallia endozanthoxylica]|uniref:Uncharacterized protein n=1 Tax=Niallia endozanthoxylica TaxID=2036016 RepID=A0A5J5I4A7_9BACI|nr:competence protein ComK [Niallia endozanthoxylica]KAA9029922.1 hypothetical protein F4V44_02655 [Niallia endozanthoxylica]
MNIRTNYIINNRTIALVSHYEMANEYTRVIHESESFIVRQPPDEIVRASFIHFGCPLEEAVDLARKILKKPDSIPIALCAKRNLILTRCKVPNQDGIVWLILSHINEIQRYRINKTTVFLTNGQSFYVDIKVNDLKNQRNLAACLCESLVNQSTEQKTKYYLYDHKKEIALALENGKLEYIVKRNKEDDEDLDLDIVLK